MSSIKPFIYKAPKGRFFLHPFCTCEKMRRYPEKSQVLFLLSVKAGLRAREIAGLRWTMVTDPEGNLADGATLHRPIVKGEKKTRFVPFNRQLKAALAGLQAQQRSFDPDAHVITSERASSTSFIKAFR